MSVEETKKYFSPMNTLKDGTWLGRSVYTLNHAFQPLKHNGQVCYQKDKYKKQTYTA